jgi:hypothetical protein
VLNARTGWKNFIFVFTNYLVSRGQKVRARKNRGVLLAATIESSKMDKIAPRVIGEEPF